MKKNLSIFVAFIEEHLDDKNYSLAEFSRIIGLADNVMHKWVKAKHYPDIECVIKFADYFDCSIDYLFGLSAAKSITLSSAPAPFVNRLNQMLLKRNLTACKLAKKNYKYLALLLIAGSKEECLLLRICCQWRFISMYLSTTLSVALTLDNSPIHMQLKNNCHKINMFLNSMLIAK